ncbi:MAG: hypothetical protein OXI59_07930 [Gemmatimonadota bacterium]|nr:hypothetical protein [Gemmatimonadota bacterium]MYH91082.1 hypothetical protein [Gammaproteobacteria bacterium]
MPVIETPEVTPERARYYDVADLTEQYMETHARVYCNSGMVGISICPYVCTSYRNLAVIVFRR